MLAAQVEVTVGRGVTGDAGGAEQDLAERRVGALRQVEQLLGADEKRRRPEAGSDAVAGVVEPAGHNIGGELDGGFIRRGRRIFWRRGGLGAAQYGGGSKNQEKKAKWVHDETG